MAVNVKNAREHTDSVSTAVSLIETDASATRVAAKSSQWKLLGYKVLQAGLREREPRWSIDYRGPAVEVPIAAVAAPSGPLPDVDLGLCGLRQGRSPLRRASATCKPRRRRRAPCVSPVAFRAGNADVALGRAGFTTKGGEQ